MQRICVLAFVGVSLVALGAACGGSDTPPAQAPVASVQPTYAPPSATTTPPAATVPQAAPGQMATPGPTALACQNDSQCVTHRCNTKYGKCAFPCQSDGDCVDGTTCITAVGPAAAFCAPKPPGQ
jgi:hypothetical protein